MSKPTNDEALEENIELKIAYYLESIGCSVDKIISEGFWNEKKQIYQRRKSPFANPGISDIIATMYPTGLSLYIEVKRPSEMNMFDVTPDEAMAALTDTIYHKKSKTPEAHKKLIKKYQHAYDQSNFIHKKRKHGAIAFFASSVEQVQERLAMYLNEKKVGKNS